MKTKRKLLSVLMTLALVLGMIPAFGVMASADEKPTKIISVTWNEDYSVTFTTDNSAVGGDYWYGVFSEKDGNMHVSKWTQPGDITFNRGTATVSTETMNSMLSNLKENGKYYVGVWFKEDTADTRVQSAARMITLQRLPAPKNMRWEGTVAKWDPVEGAAGYFLQIYSDNSYITYVETKETEKDLSSYISVPPARTYRFDMQALGSSFDKARSDTVKGPEKLFEKIPLTFKAQPESGICDREKNIILLG